MRAAPSVTAYLAAIGRKGGAVGGASKRRGDAAHYRALAARRKRVIYAAIAQHGGRDAGHVCYGRTKDEARLLARDRTTMSIVVRRELVSAEGLAQLVAAGKITA
jgi:hypothetical protein